MHKASLHKIPFQLLVEEDLFGSEGDFDLDGPLLEPGQELLLRAAPPGQPPAEDSPGAPHQLAEGLLSLQAVPGFELLPVESEELPVRLRHPLVNVWRVQSDSESSAA